MWPNYLQSLVDNPKVNENDKVLIQELIDAMKCETALPTNLLNSRFIFKKYGSFRQFEPKALITVSNFMGKEPVTGFNTLNGLLKMLRIPQIDPCNHYLKYYSKMFLVRELNILFNRLRVEDQLLSSEDLSKISDEVLS